MTLRFLIDALHPHTGSTHEGRYPHGTRGDVIVLVLAFLFPVMPHVCCQHTCHVSMVVLMEGGVTRGCPLCRTYHTMGGPFPQLWEVPQ